VTLRFVLSVIRLTLRTRRRYEFDRTGRLKALANVTVLDLPRRPWWVGADTLREEQTPSISSKPRGRVELSEDLDPFSIPGFSASAAGSDRDENLAEPFGDLRDSGATSPVRTPGRRQPRVRQSALCSWCGARVERTLPVGAPPQRVLSRHLGSALCLKRQVELYELVQRHGPEVLFAATFRSAGTRGSPFD